MAWELFSSHAKYFCSKKMTKTATNCTQILDLRLLLCLDCEPRRIASRVPSCMCCMCKFTCLSLFNSTACIIPLVSFSFLSRIFSFSSIGHSKILFKSRTIFPFFFSSWVEPLSPRCLFWTMPIYFWIQSKTHEFYSSKCYKKISIILSFPWEKSVRIQFGILISYFKQTKIAY